MVTVAIIFWILLLGVGVALIGGLIGKSIFNGLWYLCERDERDKNKDDDEKWKKDNEKFNDKKK